MFRSPILAGSHLDRISCTASSIVLKPHVGNSSPNIELDHILIPPYRPSESVFLVLGCTSSPRVILSGISHLRPCSNSQSRTAFHETRCFLAFPH
jgi:hypothetical protein